MFSLKFIGIVTMVLAALAMVGSVFLFGVMMLQAFEKSHEIDQIVASGQYVIDANRSLAAIAGVPLPSDLPSAQTAASSAKQSLFIRPFVVLFVGLLIALPVFGFGALLSHLSRRLNWQVDYLYDQFGRREDDGVAPQVWQSPSNSDQYRLPRITTNYDPRSKKWRSK